MTTQTLYNQYKEGKVTSSKFLYEIRKKQYPFLHPTNSLKDVITILKGQNMISEKKESNPDLPQVDCKTIDMVSPYEYSKGMNFELDLETKSTGQNTPETPAVIKAQNKVLKNLTKDQYYYSRKLMTDEEKKYEKGNEREYELKKKFIHNNKKGIIREQIEQEQMFSIDEDCGCDSNIDENMGSKNTLKRDLIKRFIEEWGLTEHDLQDDDVVDELQQAVLDGMSMNEEEEKGVIEVDDEMKARQLAQQGINVKLEDEN